jgi:uncharacterized protein (TIGR03067 family)
MNKYILIAILAGASGCSTLHNSDTSVLQGSWEGAEIGGKTKGMCSIVISENKAEYSGADTNEWLKATFSLREHTNPRQIVFLTTACSYPPHVGTARYAIYRFEGGAVRLTASEPGDTNVPPSFDAPGARQFVLRKR